MRAHFTARPAWPGSYPSREVKMEFVRRIGPDPHRLGPKTPNLEGCPDIWELSNGDFAVIGRTVNDLQSKLPAGASCGPDETIVLLPRGILVDARKDIPQK